MKSVVRDINANQYDIYPVLLVIFIFAFGYIFMTYAVNDIITIHNDHITSGVLTEQSQDHFEYARDAWYILPVIFLICVGLWVHTRSSMREDYGDE